MSATKIITGIATLAAITAIGIAFHENKQREIAEAHVVELTSRQDELLKQVQQNKASLEKQKQGINQHLNVASFSGLQGIVKGIEATRDANDPLGDPANAPLLKHYHSEYDPFFRKAGLSQVQIDQVLKLWLEQHHLREDIEEAMQDQKIPATESVEQLRQQLNQPLEDELRSVLGEEYKSYYDYQKDFFWGAVVEPLTSSLNAMNLSLTDEQSTRLSALVQANNHSLQASPYSLGSELHIDWDTVLSEAAGILNADQLAVLQSKVETLKRQH